MAAKRARQGWIIRYPDLDDSRAASQLEPLDGTWTAEAVEDRMIEAMRVVALAPALQGGGNPWPEILHTFEDMKDWEDWRERPLDKWFRIRPIASSAEISRMEETIVWPARYLRRHDGESRCLQAWAVAKAAHMSVRTLTRRRRRGRIYSRSVLYRQKRKGARRIAQGLIKDGVTFRESGPNNI